jgi:hypothetical protein
LSAGGASLVVAHDDGAPITEDDLMVEIWARWTEAHPSICRRPTRLSYA